MESSAGSCEACSPARSAHSRWTSLWYARYREDGGDSRFGDWEFTSELQRWDDAPAPGKMGRKIIEAVTGRDVPVERAVALSNVMHWAYGVSATVAYGLLVRAFGPRRPLWRSGYRLAQTAATGCARRCAAADTRRVHAARDAGDGPPHCIRAPSRTRTPTTRGAP
jgi:hypothetical protein